jgi:hypothetical protein
MGSKDQLDLSRLNRAVFEALEPAQLVELTCRLSHPGGGVERALGAEFDQQLAAAIVRSAFWR